MSKLYVNSNEVEGKYLSLKLGTYNARGFASMIKKDLITSDFVRYKLDILSLQETKMLVDKDITIQGHRHRYVCGNRHWGLGFILSPFWGGMNQDHR